MKVYELTTTGVITQTYSDEADFKRQKPGETIWQAGKGDAFVGGFVREDHLAKLILNGLGGSRNREYLKLKRDLSNVKQELVAKSDDLDLAKLRHTNETDKLTTELSNIKRTNKSLDESIEDVTKESAIKEDKIQKALTVLKGVL